MNRSQWIALASAIVLVVACFMPWAYILQPDLTISGIDTAGTRFGKPGYLHFVFAACILCCTFINKVGAKRINLLFAALNLAWAIRNYLIVSRCDGGECPQIHSGLYILVVASLALMLTAVFPNMKIASEKKLGDENEEG